MRYRLSPFYVFKALVGLAMICLLGGLMWILISGLVRVFYHDDQRIYYTHLTVAIASFLSGLLIRGFFMMNSDIEQWYMGNSELMGRKGAIEDELERRKKEK